MAKRVIRRLDGNKGMDVGCRIMGRLAVVHMKEFVMNA